MKSLHPIQRRVLAEDLVRLRRADEDRRYATSQRPGRIDPNPHQIDAVVFALRRIPEGGCILADEVGLGKTIEAGLVIAQLLAEGKRRVLIILPKPLLGQWQQELYSLFGVEANEGSSDPATLSGPGVFLVGREMAGSESGAKALLSVEPFDLCVIDEAHEIFAGIWRRFDSEGAYKETAPHATMAHRVRQVLSRDMPVLLLTATPIQNSLAELWGLVQYVEPTGTLFGDLSTFRQVFCEGDDRSVIPEQAHELKRRLEIVCRRTLRRQAQEFLQTPFVGRQARLFKYSMSTEEKALYEDITEYLLEPHLCAFAGAQRQLQLIGFHRRMASSRAALAASLRNVAARLERMLAGQPPAAIDEAARDFDDEDLEEALDEAVAAPASLPPAARIRAELERVLGFIARADAITADSKAGKLVEAVDLVRSRPRNKVVVFTEYLTTQEYLRDRLVGRGVPETEITLFRGQNDSARAHEALERWQAEVEGTLPAQARPRSQKVRMKLALVHEFKTRSSVFISTEAGAKGLNLQFADTLINYDLPWNPQRIEQRIGRCHRYGQTHDVTVVNFIAQDNETEQLLFDILSAKLDLFGEVLDASDVVLHSPATDAPETLSTALGSDVERAMNRMFLRARTQDDIQEELRRIRQTVEERRKKFEEALARAEHLVRSRLDENVRAVFRQIQEKLRLTLAQLDHDIDRVVSGYLDAVGAPYRRSHQEQRIVFELEPNGVLGEGLAAGGQFVVGRLNGKDGAQLVHVGHPLVAAAVEDARRSTAGGPLRVRIRLDQTADSSLVALRGRRGRMTLSRARYEGFEPVERLLLTALIDGEPSPIAEQTVRRLLEMSVEDAPGVRSAVDPEAMQDAVEEHLFLDQAIVSQTEQQRFERLLEQIERYADDRVLILKRARDAALARLASVEARRDAALGVQQRERAEREQATIEDELDVIEDRIGQFLDRNDDAFRRCRERALERRFARPAVERLFSLELEVA